MTSASIKEFSFAQMAAGLPFLALVRSASMRSKSVDLSDRGEIEIFSSVFGWA